MRSRHTEDGVQYGRCRSVARWGALLVVPLALASCGGSHTESSAKTSTSATSAPGRAPSRGGSGRTTPAGSAWGHVLAQVRPDGQVSLSTALAAFEVAVGPVPGAVTPTGTPAALTSGTLAVAWVLARWAELDAAQQQAVAHDLGARLSVTTAARGPGAVATGAALDAAFSGLPATTANNPDLPCPTTNSAGSAAYVAQVSAIKAEIAGHVGTGYTGPVYVEINTKNVLPVGDPFTEADMYTYGCSGPSVATGAVTGCAVHIEPHTLGGQYSAADIHAFFVHELTHCLLLQHFGARYGQFPAWYLEGVPTWVESVLGGGDKTSDSWWVGYLETQKTTLFQRSYDGLGFFAHLAETGTDVWKVIMPIGTAFATHGNSNAAGWSAASPTPDFLNSWGPSFATGRYSGSAWATGGPGLPHYDAPLPSEAQLGDGGAISASSGAAASALRPVDIDAAVVQVVSASSAAHGMISLGLGQAATLATATTDVYCSQPTCTCPELSAHFGQKFVHIGDGLEYVGIAGGLSSASVILTGESLGSYCGESCIIGRWVTTGTGGSFASGGAGIIWTLNEEGGVEVDYNSSEPMLLAHTLDYTYRGTADYKITSVHVLSPTKGSYVARPTGSGVTASYYLFGKEKTEEVGVATHSTSYTCGATSLVLDVIIPHSSIIYHLKRTGPAPAGVTTK